MHDLAVVIYPGDTKAQVVDALKPRGSRVIGDDGGQALLVVASALAPLGRALAAGAEVIDREIPVFLLVGGYWKLWTVARVQDVADRTVKVAVAAPEDSWLTVVLTVTGTHDWQAWEMRSAQRIRA